MAKKTVKSDYWTCESCGNTMKLDIKVSHWIDLMPSQGGFAQNDIEDSSEYELSNHLICRSCGCDHKLTKAEKDDILKRMNEDLYRMVRYGRWAED